MPSQSRTSRGSSGQSGSGSGSGTPVGPGVPVGPPPPVSIGGKMPVGCCGPLSMGLVSVGVGVLLSPGVKVSSVSGKSMVSTSVSGSTSLSGPSGSESSTVSVSLGSSPLSVHADIASARTRIPIRRIPVSSIQPRLIMPGGPVQPKPRTRRAALRCSTDPTGVAWICQKVSPGGV